MDKSASITCVAALSLAALLPAWRSEASTSMAIQKCSGANGDPAYTDAACSTLGAGQATMPEDLVARLARDEARYGPEPGLQRHSALLSTARRPVEAGCAHSPRQLATDLAGSMALDDVNRVAESFHWAGMSTRRGQAMLEALRTLSGKQVQGGRYFSAFPAGSESGTPVGRMQLVLADDGSRRALQLDVHHHAGCYFASL